jgi:hypothetical protein
LSALLSFVVAYYAVRVATRQSKTAQEKLRLDFFDKRFRLWEDTNTAMRLRWEYVQTLTAETFNGAGEVRLDGMVEFLAAYRQAQFLFGPEVVAQYDLIKHDLERYLGARVATFYIADAPAGNRAAIASAPGDAFMRIMNDQERLRGLVQPYLDLSQVAVIRAAKGAGIGPQLTLIAAGLRRWPRRRS